MRQILDTDITEPRKKNAIKNSWPLKQVSKKETRFIPWSKSQLNNSKCPFEFFKFTKKQERMWNSFQGDRESGLFWLLSESIEKD